MKIDIYRKVETSESSTGEFWLEGVQQCYYLEALRTTPFWPGHPCTAQSWQERSPKADLA